LNGFFVLCVPSLPFFMFSFFCFFYLHQPVESTVSEFSLNPEISQQRNT